MSRTPRLTNVPNFKNAPLVGLAEGNGSFSNYVLASVVLGLPWLLKRVLPFINRGGFKTYLFLTALLGVPITMAYWTLMSMFGPRKNEKVVLPGKDIEEYINIKDPELRARYHGKEKIPMQIFHDAYFDGKIDFNGISLLVPLGILFDRHRHVGDVLDTLEARHDWAKMVFTPELFKYVLTQMIPEIIVHSESQDEEQVRGHYDRTHHYL
jgi:sphingolipid C9-methyltransferase